jgi:type IV secretion system protein VirD4
MSSGRPKFTGDSSDMLFLVGLVLFGGLGAWLWLSGQVAGVLFGPAWIKVGIGDLPGIAIALPGTITDPAQAWPEAAQAHLPGPVGFTIATILAGAIVAAAVAVIAIGLNRFTASNGNNGMASAAELDRKLSRAAAMRKARRLRPT